MSNPIASETPHGTVLHEGHYGPVHCHCSECDYLVDSAEAQLQSDPSGKGARLPEDVALAWLQEKFGTHTSAEHGPKLRLVQRGTKDDACLFILDRENIEYRFAQVLAMYAASLRQQLSDSQATIAFWKGRADKLASERDDAMIGQRARQHQFEEMSTLCDEAVAQRDEAQGKVSQLEADNAKLLASNKYCSETVIGDMLESAVGTMEANQRAEAAESQVSVLTKEREELRLRIAAWEKLFPMSRFVIEADDAKQILWQDFVPKGAVSEVVRTGKLLDAALTAEFGEDHEYQTDDWAVAQREHMTALTNYEKAQQKGGQ